VCKSRCNLSVRYSEREEKAANIEEGDNNFYSNETRPRRTRDRGAGRRRGRKEEGETE